MSIIDVKESEKSKNEEISWILNDQQAQSDSSYLTSSLNDYDLTNISYSWLNLFTR